MKYLLVIQFKDLIGLSSDYLIGLAEQMEHISPEHEVDGHDLGNNEFNIFIYTNSPQSAVAEIEEILSMCYHGPYIVAYRGVNEEEYEVILPENYLGNFAII